MRYLLELTLEGTPKPPNKLLGHSKWVKHNNAKLWKQQVRIAISRDKLPAAPLTKAKLTFVRHSYRMLDFDGLCGSMKPLADSLTEIGVIIDDRWSVTGKWDVDQKFSPKGKSFVTIKVESVD